MSSMLIPYSSECSSLRDIEANINLWSNWKKDLRVLHSQVVKGGYF